MERALARYFFSMRHIKGMANLAADCMSRSVECTLRVGATGMEEQDEEEPFFL